MRIKTIGVSNYRNIPLARLDVDSSRVFLVGRNGQGKTNLLEAIGYVTSLRAFRARESETLIGPQGSTAEIVHEVEHELMGECRSQLRIKRKGKEATLDGERIRRASDFVGRLPTVTLSSEDLTIVRGAPGGRRRFVDTLLCGLDRAYYVALQRYQKALLERNALLKRGGDAHVLAAFEQQMAEPAVEIVAKRQIALAEIARLAIEYYERLSEGQEAIGIEYRPSVAIESAEAYGALLLKQRPRDAILQSTGKGPHRDDFDLMLDARSAGDYASDGQQRSIALALAFATIDCWRTRYGVAPALLVDDVLGELDPQRKERFWEALDPSIQLIATGTELPQREGLDQWIVYEVARGAFARKQ